MARRGSHEGSIYKRKDGRWTASIHLGYEGGRRRRKEFSGKTRHEVARKLSAALRARDQGLPQPAERQTVAAFLAGWLESVKPSLRPHTWTRYEGLIRVHALPNLGRLPLAKVTPDRLQKLYANRLEAGQSAASVRQLHAVLHRAFRQAARWGVVARNVADLVTPPRVKRREMQALSPEQSRVFLRWRDVDLDAGLLAVRGSLSRTPDGLTIAEPKTARSRRQIELTATAIEALRRHRASQAEARGILGRHGSRFYQRDRGLSI